MAKKQQATVEKQQELDNYEVSEAMGPYLEIMPNRKQIRVSMILDRFKELTLGEKLDAPTVRIMVDRARYGSPAIMAEDLDYGFVKKRKDSAGTRAEDDDDVAYMAQIVANCEKRIAWGEGLVTMQSSTPYDTVGTELRQLLIGWLKDNRTQENGKKYTSTTLPSVLVKAKTSTAVAAAGKEVGIPEGIIALQMNLAETIIGLKQDARKLQVEVKPKS